MMMKLMLLVYLGQLVRVEFYRLLHHTREEDILRFASSACAGLRRVVISEEMEREVHGRHGMQ